MNPMPRTEKQEQERAALGRDWDFLASSLQSEAQIRNDAHDLHEEIESLIYFYAGRVTLANAVGILEVIKHDLITGTR